MKTTDATPDTWIPIGSVLDGLMHKAQSRKVAASPTAKERHCWCCGGSMGVIERKHYRPEDTCGKYECERAARDAERQEREDAHDRLDRDNGWDRW